MRWRDLTWLERIWVYNSVPAMFVSLGAIFALHYLYPPDSGALSAASWIAFAGQIFWAACFLFAAVASGERVFGKGAYWRARRAILTRGMRTRRRPGRHAVIAYPEGDRIMLRVSSYQFKLRPWPLAMPVRLDAYGDFSRGVDIDDQAGLAEAFAELNERARQANQDDMRRARRDRRADQVATRINAQRH